jgi:hypothetical protein
MKKRAKQRGVAPPDDAPAYGKIQDMGPGGGRMRQAYRKVSGSSVTPESCAATSLSCLRKRVLRCLSELELETDCEGIEIGIRHFITFRIEA